MSEPCLQRPVSLARTTIYWKKAIRNRAALDRLTKDYQDLSEKAQQLLTEKLFLENEMNQLKKRSNRLEEELSNIRTPPLIVGFIQDVVDEQAIVRSSNGTVFLVSVNRRLDRSKIKPGTRVALNQDTLSVVEILADSWDPLVSNTEIIDTPDVSLFLYRGFRGTDQGAQRSNRATVRKSEGVLRHGD